jgi:hypothetical protein
VPSSEEPSTTFTPPLGDSPDLAIKTSTRELRVADIETYHDNGPIARKEEVSAEVPKFGVSGESHRASVFEIPKVEKDEA